MKKYTEHEKMKAVNDKSQAIGDFLVWLRCRDVELCKYEDRKLICGKKKCPESNMNGKCFIEPRKGCKNHHHTDLLCYNVFHSGYQPIHYSIEGILADFFNIDLKKVEEEKIQILDDIRARLDKK